MAQDRDLVGLFAEMVVGGSDGKALAERTLDIVLAMSRARAAAILKKEKNRVTLFAARGIDQAVLDAVETIWSRYRSGLEAGEVFYLADPRNDPRIRKGGGAQDFPPSVAVLPIFDSGSLVALLYLDGRVPGFCEPSDLKRLGQLAKVISKAVRDVDEAEPPKSGWHDYLERTSLEDLEREKLLIALERSNWTIARAARALGVSRLTIYKRLRRLKISPKKARQERRKSGGQGGDTAVS